MTTQRWVPKLSFLDGWFAIERPTMGDETDFAITTSNPARARQFATEAECAAWCATVPQHVTTYVPVKVAIPEARPL